MVTHISFAVDDETADSAKQIKDEHGLSWPEFLDLAVDSLSGSGVLDEYNDLREDTAVVHPTGIQVTPSGDGAWTDLECGCRYAIGREDGQLYVMCCDDHGVDEVVEQLEERQKTGNDSILGEGTEVDND